MKKQVTVFILFVCCFIFVSCNNQETSIKTAENDNKSEIMEEAKEAYVYARNLAVLHSVLNNSKEFDEVVGKEIQQPEELKIYREKNIDKNSEDETYYFMDIDVGSCLNYSKTKKKWGTMFGLAYKADFDELLSKDELEFVGEVNINYPNVYFPETTLTDYKRSCLEVIKCYIKEYLEEYMKKGEYRITVMDFSDVDNYTQFMIQNNNGERSVLPINITEDTESGLHAEVRANVITPDFKEDFDLGGIKYSELFSKLSVESYTLEIP